jgi:hypothetical protein
MLRLFNNIYCNHSEIAYYLFYISSASVTNVYQVNAFQDLSSERTSAFIPCHML